MNVTPEKYAVQGLEIITRSTEAVTAGILVKEEGSDNNKRTARRSGQKSYELLTVLTSPASRKCFVLDYESNWYDDRGPHITVQVTVSEGEEGWAEINALWTRLE